MLGPMCSGLLQQQRQGDPMQKRPLLVRAWNFTSKEKVNFVVYIIELVPAPLNAHLI